MMATPLKSPEVHPEDQEIITQLAALQDMHNQVILTTSSLVDANKSDRFLN